MTERITSTIMKNIEQMLEEIREKYTIPLNVKFIVYDNDLPIEKLIGHLVLGLLEEKKQ